MKVLVAAASKHGATAGIAARIGERLRGHGVACEVHDLGDEPDPSGYQAFVLGSGVYAGQWLKDGRRYVDAHAAGMADAGVWLFSSGPLGDPLKPDDDQAVNVDGIAAATNARGHRLFAGALDKSKLSFGEKAIIKAVRAADGDFRDWAAIDAWADEIYAALTDDT